MKKNTAKKTQKEKCTEFCNTRMRPSDMKIIHTVALLCDMTIPELLRKAVRIAAPGLIEKAKEEAAWARSITRNTKINTKKQ